MPRYELLILASPEITKDEESNLETHIDKLINKSKGSIVSFDRWGKYRLAYPVRKNEYGVYFLLRFDTKDKNLIKEIERMFYVKLNSIVMRSIFSRLDQDQSLEYKKPPSLEDAPKKTRGFLEEKELKPRGTAFVKKGKEIDKPEGIAEGKKSEPAAAAEEALSQGSGGLDLKKEEAAVSKEKEVKELPETKDIEKKEV